MSKCCPEVGIFLFSAEAETAELKNGRSFAEAYFVRNLLLARAVDFSRSISISLAKM
jgi:hypothetical protein